MPYCPSQAAQEQDRQFLDCAPRLQQTLQARITEVDKTMGVYHGRSFMLIWSGLGFIVPVICFGSLLATQLSVQELFQDSHYYEAHGWPKLLGMLVAAAIIWPVGKVIDQRTGRELVDPTTGERVIVGGNHTFFFVPTKWWPLACIALGAVLLFAV